MIGYTTLGVSDISRAAAFYDPLFAELGAKRMIDSERFIAWTTGPKTTGFGIALPFDGKPASVGNGTMIALVVDSREKVDRIHAKALELGSVDEGPVGERFPGFYAGYFRDLDGNKLNVFCMGQPAQASS